MFKQILISYLIQGKCGDTVNHDEYKD